MSTNAVEEVNRMPDGRVKYAPNGMFIGYYPPEMNAAYAQECVSSHYPKRKAQDMHSFLRSDGYHTCTHCGVRYVDVTWGEDP